MIAARRPWDWRFALITLAALIGIAVTASLGRWQLSRAAQKEALQTALVERQALPAIDGNRLTWSDAASDDWAALQHRRVVLEGQWLADQTVYLENRQMGGRPGFFVVTPLQLPGQDTVVLVQRGWAPRHFQDRTRLPEVDTPAGSVRLEGRLAPWPAKLYEFDAPAASGAVRIRQNLDPQAYATEVGRSLAPVSLLQTDALADGLQRDWPQATLSADKNYGYAFQWFGLCGLIALLYVWFQIVRHFLRPGRQPNADSR